jgi:transcriptional regulator with XRE-family HTH domain
VDIPALIAGARSRAGLTQRELAGRSGTSQPALSAYESGAKVPSAATLARILAACGERLTTVPSSRPVRSPAAAELAHAGRTLADVLDLAAELPVRHSDRVRYPGLPRRSQR